MITTVLVTAAVMYVVFCVAAIELPNCVWRWKTKRMLTRLAAGLEPVAVPRSLEPCPACHGPLTGHLVASVGTAVVADGLDNETLRSEFLGAIRAHDWTRARSFRSFDAMRDALEARALKCPSGAMTTIVVYDPFELWEDARVVETEVLGNQESLALHSMLQEDQWRRVRAL